jgi:hypothetical protein
VADDFTPASTRRLKGKVNPKAAAKAARKPTASMSPNFYSLRGSGTNAVLITGYDFQDAYTLEGAVQIGPGEGGLVFDCTETGAYHAFTVQPEEDSDTVRLSLWRTESSNATSRTELAAVTTELVNGQWVMLKIRTFQNRIQAFVDKTQVIDIPAELPVGGRFGLFADSDVPLLFDDVTTRSNHDLDFLGVNDIRRHSLLENGRFFPRRGFFGLFSPRETPFLTPPQAGVPQWLVVGAASHGAHVFSAEFQPLGGAYDIGLLAGYTDRNRPHLRFTCRRNTTTETFRLETVDPTNATTTLLKSLSVPRTPGKNDASEPVTLMCDATSGNELRCYRNHELVLVHHAASPVGGASGVFVGPDTRVRLANPEYAFARADLYTDQFEKNSIFVNDRFMRHWSSPEGQWADVTNGITWYKGDVFGRVSVHLPLVDQTAVHLGVVDGTTTGAWVVSVSNQMLSLRPGADLATTNAPLVAIPTNRLTGFVGPATNQTVGYTIHAEGRWLWLTSGDALLFEQALPTPLAGRRLLIAGFTTEQLASSRVERYNVKDFLFKESLHEWTRNGGRWEVINRFTCDPRWSHMNGESTNTLAALWSKYLFRGDFCVEMYAGTRHGWYTRPGDYNLTVMNRDTTSSQGYTVTCSGWDHDLSQLYTTLYRNGKVLAQSNAYCAPRTREGNRRKVHLPLIEAGRDVHGAWYYLKFRRAGNKLEFYFDNELVFTADDNDPLSEGSLGVWTFMNSIMVARVKIAAESVFPKPVIFKPAVPSNTPPTTDPVAEVNATTNAPVSQKAGSIGSMDPDAWDVDDPVSQARLTWLAPTSSSPYFAVTSVLGSGSLLTRYNLPPVPYPELAGWHFDVKRTARGQFNFYYSIGRRNAEGAYVPERFYFHQISGDDFSKSRYQCTGQTEVPGISPTNAAAEWHTDGPWTSVTAWLPVAGWKTSVNDTGVLVRVEGWGNLQAGYVIQGLTGNGPGEGYAVRNFSGIPYPVTSPAPSLTCSWSRRQPDTVEIRSSASALDRAYACARVLLGSTEVQSRFEAPSLLEAALPRLNDAGFGPTSNLTVSLLYGTNVNAFTLKWSEAPLHTPPLLMKLEGITPLFETFEQRTVGGSAPPDRMRITDFDPDQGSFLTLFNTSLGQRLNGDFGPGLTLARHPVVQFRYRGSAMARVSLSCGPVGSVRLSEPSGPARTVRGAGELRLDNQWHTWWGLVTDAAGEQAYHPGALSTGGLRFGSVDGADQTGMYTELSLDDLTVGPAVARNEQLAFTPHYFDFEGVTQVQMALRSGSEDYLSLAATQRAALVWRDIPNAQQTIPETKELGNGLAHLFLKARNSRGLFSPVTDIPFLVDRTPPTVTFSFDAPATVMGNGSCLRLGVETAGGAPLDIEMMKIKWNDTVVTVPQTLGSTFLHSPERDTLLLNWPLIFRQQLNQAEANQAFKIVLTDIRDGAGNAVADVECPRRIDYASDHTPPTLLPTTYPSNVFWTTSWEVNSEARSFFTAQGSSTAAVVRKTGEAPYLALGSGSVTGALTCAFTPKWNVKTHPYLAFRLRHPSLDSNNVPRVSVVIEVEPTNTYTLALADLPATPGGPVPPKPSTWQSNVWESFTLDLAALLKDKRPPGASGHIMVKGLTFLSVGTKTNIAQHLQSVFVFAPWSTNDLIRMDAYDESGIGGIMWESAQQTTAMSLTPASLPGTAEENGWMTLRVRDKAGNLSTPLHVPTRVRR